MKLYRITDGGKGKPKTNKARLRREARERRRKMWEARQERKRLRIERWERRKRLEAGLPLLTEAELENL